MSRVFLSIIFALSICAAGWADTYLCTGAANAECIRNGINAKLVNGSTYSSDTEIFVPAGKGFAYFEHIYDDKSVKVVRINPRSEDGNFEGSLELAEALFGK